MRTLVALYFAIAQAGHMAASLDALHVRNMFVCIALEIAVASLTAYVILNYDLVRRSAPVQKGNEE